MLMKVMLNFLANENAVRFLHKLFKVCFVSGNFPSMWKKGIICPVPKSNMPDVQDPKCYHGISLAVSSYKLFCSVLNSRLKDWAEQNEAVVEEQNGFRTNRSCIDHIHSLVNIVDTRMRIKQSNFAVFIDFQKVYDSVNRDHLWTKLSRLGLPFQSKVHTAL